MGGYIATAKKVEWTTPEHVLSLVYTFFDGPPDLDPCGHPESKVGAKREIMPPDDGLQAEWTGKVFVNPPYDNLAPWCDMASSARHYDGSEVLLLIPSRTDTVAWQDYVSDADAILFWGGRLKFGDSKTSAPFPSALVYFGDRVDEFWDVFCEHGHMMVNYTSARECR